MKKLKVLVLVSFLPLLVYGQKLSPDEIVRKADEARFPKGSLSFNVKVTDLDGDKKSAETLYQVSSKDSSKALVETKEPARLSGRKLLMQDEELWIFLPDLKKPTRIGFEQRLTGEVSNGDIARTNFSEDYNSKLVGTEKLDGKMCYKLVLTAKKKTTPYRKIQYWVEKKSFYPVKINFFALSGKLLKVGEYSEPQKVLGKHRVTKLMISDAIQKHHQSHLVYSNFKKAKFEDSYFNKETISDE